MVGDGERAARSIGWLEGFAAFLWTLGDGKLACEAVATYEEHVETLRKALAQKEPATIEDWEDCK